MRLIDADKLIENHFSDSHNIALSYANKCWIRKIIQSEAAIDAVEVVRCKDCIYWSYDGRCEPIENGLIMEYTTGLDYCSYGKRREE